MKAKQEENPLVIINGILIDGRACSGDIVIPDSVTSIGDAFGECKNLINIILPDSVTSIGDHAFSLCENLASINIPDSVSSIGIAAFASCSSLTSITIPERVTSIKDNTFANCDNLTSIKIPKSVTSIGEHAFINTSWLKAKQEENPLVIVNGILIDGRICSGDITVPDGVTRIGSWAFENCSALTSITIPDGVTSIGYLAFYMCLNLTNIDIPESLIRIENAAFLNTPWLNEKRKESPLVIAGSVLIEVKCSGDITISEGVKSIGYMAFASTTMTSVTIPDSLISIDDPTFFRHKDLIIYGYTGSYAEEYAAENDIPFIAIEHPTAQKGDLNGDGELTVSGAVSLLRFITGEAAEEPLDTAAADVNADGIVDLLDLRALLLLLT